MRHPDWWAWELELSPHILKRMLDRDFSEVDLRLMMECATDLRWSREPGRWVVETVLGSRRWEIVVEPDRALEVTVAITAYPVSGT